MSRICRNMEDSGKHRSHGLEHGSRCGSLLPTSTPLPCEASTGSTVWNMTRRCGSSQPTPTPLPCGATKPQEKCYIRKPQTKNGRRERDTKHSRCARGGSQRRPRARNARRRVDPRGRRPRNPAGSETLINGRLRGCSAACPSGDAARRRQCH